MKQIMDKSEDKNNLVSIIKQFLNSSMLKRYDILKDRMTMMEICNTRETETAHSAFLKWIFSDSEFTRLETSPIILLLQLYAEKSKDQNKTNEKFDNLISEITDGLIPIIVEGRTEVSIGDKGRVDIELIINREQPDRELFICIENKINSTEKNQQCTGYYEYYKDKAILIFLSPQEDNCSQDEHFVHILYQDILDCILLPTLKNNGQFINCKNRYYLEDYVNTLTSIHDSNSPIAMSKEYVDILEEIYNKYCEVFYAAINRFGSKDEIEALDEATGCNTRFIVRLNGVDKGSVRGFTKMAILVIKTLVKDCCKPVSDLIKKIGRIDNLKGIDSVVISIKRDKGADSRYSPTIIRAHANQPTLWISNQWNLEKVNKFITLVQEKFPMIRIERHANWPQ